MCSHFFLRKSSLAVPRCSMIVREACCHKSTSRTKSTKSNAIMLSTILRSSTNRPPLLLRHPPSSMMTQKLLRQTTQAILNHPSVAHQWQRSLSVLPSMNILPTTRAIHTDGTNRGQEGIRRLCSNNTSSHIKIPVDNFWNRSSPLHTTTSSLTIPHHHHHQVRQFSSNGNLGNIFQHAQNNTNKKPGETLEQYGVDLTQLAKEGKLDPVIGRHEEIRRTLQILARRTKNNPVLIGEPGVGKLYFNFCVCRFVVSMSTTTCGASYCSGN